MVAASWLLGCLLACWLVGLLACLLDGLVGWLVGLVLVCKSALGLSSSSHTTTGFLHWRSGPGTWSYHCGSALYPGAMGPGDLGPGRQFPSRFTCIKCFVVGTPEKCGFPVGFPSKPTERREPQTRQTQVHFVLRMRGRRCEGADSGAAGPPQLVSGLEDAGGMLAWHREFVRLDCWKPSMRA